MHSPYQFADVSSAKQQHSDITFMDMLKQFFPLFFLVVWMFKGMNGSTCDHIMLTRKSIYMISLEGVVSSVQNLCFRNICMK